MFVPKQTRMNAGAALAEGKKVDPEGHRPRDGCGPAMWRPRTERSHSSHTPSRNDPVAEAVGLNEQGRLGGHSVTGRGR